jgi:hypothetical protein
MSIYGIWNIFSKILTSERTLFLKNRVSNTKNIKIAIQIPLAKIQSIIFMIKNNQ